MLALSRFPRRKKTNILNKTKKFSFYHNPGFEPPIFRQLGGRWSHKLNENLVRLRFTICGMNYISAGILVWPAVWVNSGGWEGGREGGLTLCFALFFCDLIFGLVGSIFLSSFDCVHFPAVNSRPTLPRDSSVPAGGSIQGVCRTSSSKKLFLL